MRCMEQPTTRQRDPRHLGLLTWVAILDQDRPASAAAVATPFALEPVEVLLDLLRGAAEV